MGDHLTEEQAKRLMEISGQLKKLLDMGAVGARAASIDSTLIPGDLVDMVWNVIFGKSREECLDDEKRKGGLFILSMWNSHPLLSWHLNNISKEQIVMLLATTVAMVGKRMGNDKGIIEATIMTLEALKEQEDTEESGEKPH